MKDLQIVNTVLYEIANLLANNSTLQRLLVDDSNDPYSGSYTPKTPQQMLDEKYISIVPTIEIGLDSTTKNCFVQVYIDEVAIRDDTVNSYGVLFAVVDKDHVMIENNKNRLLCIVNEIVKILDEKKLSAAGTISINSISFVPIDEQRFAYRFGFNFRDVTTTKRAEI